MDGRLPAVPFAGVWMTTGGRDNDTLAEQVDRDAALLGVTVLDEADVAANGTGGLAVIVVMPTPRDDGWAGIRNLDTPFQEHIETLVRWAGAIDDDPARTVEHEGDSVAVDSVEQRFEFLLVWKVRLETLPPPSRALLTDAFRDRLQSFAEVMLGPRDERRIVGGRIVIDAPVIGYRSDTPGHVPDSSVGVMRSHASRSHRWSLIAEPTRNAFKRCRLIARRTVDGLRRA